MRSQGKIIEWNDARGFGFVQQHGSEERVFAHISNFPDPRVRPAVGEVITYEVLMDRGRAQASAIAYVSRAAVTRQKLGPERHGRHSSGGGWLGAALFIALVAMVVWRYQVRHEERLEDERKYLASRSALAPESTKPSGNIQCTGKQYCSQMGSCAEARFYLKHCPDTKMDGDGDGEPCENMCGG